MIAAMRVALKTLRKIVFEVTKKEMDTSGFDNIWDSIRADYTEEDYDLHTIENFTDDGVVFFELTKKVKNVGFVGG